jgi:glycosyltransferase involved in cell wall biosynthesis
MVELTAPDFKLRAVFQADEVDPLLKLLTDAGVNFIVVHQLLGYTAGLIASLTGFAAGRHMVNFIHDFYAACPRVTLIDPAGRFCGVADADTCSRCLALGGAHEASALTDLAPAAHRALFQAFFAACAHITIPSRDAARHLRAAFPDIVPFVVPHLHRAGPPAPARRLSHNIAVLGAIGPHKGSARLMEIARLARITHPELRFHVIGYTDIDADLLKLGNVSISGKYAPGELSALLDKAQAGIALFLHGWPETFSFTLTEAVMNGLLPLVPDIGAPADRVRFSGIGAVFPFPATPSEMLAAISNTQAAGPAVVTEDSWSRLTGVTAVEELAALWECKSSGRYAVPNPAATVLREQQTGLRKSAGSARRFGPQKSRIARTTKEMS